MSCSSSFLHLALFDNRNQKKVGISLMVCTYKLMMFFSMVTTNEI